VDGGAPILTQLPPQTGIKWSGDGKYLFLEGKVAYNVGKTFVLPLAPGQVVPERLIHGLPSLEEIVQIPGARAIPVVDVAPGPTADIYAFTRVTVQRNLYRVPVP
jgi:hypothetical protein